MTPVTLIVFSYNRPRMLLDALLSIKKAGQVILLDDGSDFDVHSMIRGICSPGWGNIDIRVAPPLTVDERLKTARFGKNANQAIRDAKYDIITYLCDDDLLHRDWLPAVQAFFEENPGEHIVRGPWGVFQDRSIPKPAGGVYLCPLPSFLTTGNFAHRRECSVECGSWWGEGTVGSHDQALVRKIAVKHPVKDVPTLKAQAGWRRLHPYNMMAFVKPNNVNGEYAENAREVPERKVLE